MEECRILILDLLLKCVKFSFEIGLPLFVDKMFASLDCEYRFQ